MVFESLARAALEFLNPGAPPHEPAPSKSIRGTGHPPCLTRTSTIGPINPPPPPSKPSSLRRRRHGER
jgi:hypothetical protein